MSVEKIQQNIKHFDKRNKVLLKILLIAIISALLISLMPLFLKYKTRILSSVIKAKNQNIKINKISIINDLKAVDISMMLFNKDFDINIKAENLEPEKDNPDKSMRCHFNLGLACSNSCQYLKHIRQKFLHLLYFV